MKNTIIALKKNTNCARLFIGIQWFRCGKKRTNYILKGSIFMPSSCYNATFSRDFFIKSSLFQGSFSKNRHFFKRLSLQIYTNITKPPTYNQPESHKKAMKKQQ